MAIYTLTFDVSAAFSAGMPKLQIKFGGVKLDTTYVGAGSSTLSYQIDTDGPFDHSLLRFYFVKNYGSGGDTIDISNVRLNGDPVDLSAFTHNKGSSGNASSISLTQGSYSDYNTTNEIPEVQDIESGPAATITGTNGDDRLYGTDSGDVIDGLDGNDRIIAKDSIDTVNGGNGNDTISGQGGNDTLNGNAGDDRIYGGDGNDQIYGGTEDDRLYGNDGVDNLYGEDGNDRLVGGNDDDFLYGGNGDDVIGGDAGDDTIEGNAGNDQLFGGDGNDTIRGGADNDRIVGNAGNDFLYGDDGDDNIDGQLGQDRLEGGAGNDILDGEEDNDTILGDDGEDYVIGGAGQDILRGGNDNDILYGDGISSYDQYVIRDTSAWGRSGVYFSEQTQNFYRYVSAPVDYTTAVGDAESSLLSGVAGHLVSIGSQAEQDFLFNIYGLGGSNTWIGASDNIIEGEWRWGGGAEGGVSFYGDEITNAYSNWAGGAPGGGDYAFINTAGLWGTDNGSSTYGYIIEWDGSDIISDATRDFIYGDAGDDILYGGGGNDRMEGGADDDILYGEDGVDTMLGDAGNDTLIGGNGGDTLYGGEGNDVLYAYNPYLANANTLEEQILSDSPVAYWRLDETSGATAVNLGTGAGLNSTYVNGVSQGAGALYGGGSVSANFDGTNDYIDVPTSTLINDRIIQERSIELVFNADTTSGRQVLYEEGGGTNAIVMYIDNGNIYFNVRDSSGTAWGPFNITTSISAGETYHAALIIDTNNSLVEGYLNGNLVGSGTALTDLSAHTGDIGIGAMNNATYFHDGAQSGGGYYFDGRISDVAIYNSVLTATDIQNRASFVTTGGAGSSFNDGRDILYGGNGDDTLYASAGNDDLYGEDGNDILYGGEGFNTITGGDGNDIIYSDTYVTGAAGAIGDLMQADVLSNNPVAYWRLNDSSGVTADNLGTLGSTVDGTYTNGVTLNGAPLYSGAGSSADFDGINDVIAIPDSNGINTTSVSARTIELTFNADTTAGRQVLYEEGGATNAIVLYIDNGDLYFNARDGNGAVWGPFSINTPISAGTTYHAALVVDEAGGNIRGYLDGALVGSGAIDGPLNSHNGDIGIGGVRNDTYFHDGGFNGDGHYFDGRISDVAIYNSVLANSEIQQHSDIVHGTFSFSGGWSDTIIGGDGFDQLYAGAGRDEFIFEGANAFNNVDEINGYNFIEGDTLDISDLLGGFSGVITDYVSLSESGGNTTVAVDADGLGGGSSMTDVVQLNGITGLDINIMYNSGVLVAV